MAQNQEITHDFILQFTGSKKLSDIKDLKLDIGLDSVDVAVFEKLKNLKSLDLSNNNIQRLSTFFLPKLKSLNLCNNQLTDFTFLSELSTLEEVYLEGNFATFSDKYIVTELIPTLKNIDRTKCSSLQKSMQVIKSNINSQLQKIYEKEVEPNHPNGIPESEFEDVVKQLKKAFYSTHGNEKEFIGKTHKYRQFLVEKLSRLLGLYSEKGTMPKKRRRIENEVYRVKGDGDNGEECQVFTAIKNKNTASLLPVPDYDPVHFIKCHSKDDNQKDNKTRVWKCAFAPKHLNGCESPIVASCGGDSVCFIDCSTGKLMKKFKQTNEDFFALAWTTLMIENKAMNILAVAGYRGIIQLIHPPQNITYADLKGHTKYVGSLLFHPDNATWLFSGSADGKIILWDIGVPTLPEYNTQYSQLVVLKSPGGDVLNLVFTKNHLVAGCDKGCFAWNFPEKDSKIQREPSFEVILPKLSKSDDKLVDSVVQTSKDFIITKCPMQGCILAWKMTDTLAVVKQGKSKVTNATFLEWTRTDEPYINMAVNDDLLVCGDDNGSVWIYNLQNIHKNVAITKNVLAPSQKLEWPKCNVPADMEQLLKKDAKVIINCAAVSQDQSYVVLGTENNLVCIWKLNKEMD